MGGSHGHHPSKVKLFKNRPHMTFDDAQSKSDQVCSFYLLKADQGPFKYYVRWVGGSKNGYFGGSHGHHPSKVKLFKNRPYMIFDDAQSKSDQVCSVYLLT